MDKKLEEVEFVIFDTETTGLEPESGDRIVEIAAVRFKGSEILATFQSLVNPRRPISQAAFAVNKISAEMLASAPLMETVLPEFLRFIKGSYLCSYNTAFDLGFLENEIRLCGLNPPEDLAAADILRMARKLLPGLERYGLWFVAQRLGIKGNQEHRALSDVEMTREAFIKLLEIMRIKGIADFRSFYSLFGMNKANSRDTINQKVSRIYEALGLGVKLKIKYLSSGATVSEREVIPKEIRQENNRWYLVGHCCLRNEERTFRIDGILHLEIL